MDRPPDSPRITHISWGRLEIDDGRTFKDAKLYPGGGPEWNWRETGTEHQPGIQAADVEELLDHRVTVVVLSKGMMERLQVQPETIRMLEQRWRASRAWSVSRRVCGAPSSPRSREEDVAVCRDSAWEPLLRGVDPRLQLPVHDPPAELQAVCDGDLLAGVGVGCAASPDPRAMARGGDAHFERPAVWFAFGLCGGLDHVPVILDAVAHGPPGQMSSDFVTSRA